MHELRLRKGSLTCKTQCPQRGCRARHAGVIRCGGDLVGFRALWFTASIMRITTPLLRLGNISKSFGAVRALRSVSFDSFAGEVHALVGENGAGKSTLIKIITGADQPDAGTIELNGALVPNLKPAAARALGIAAIYQQPALFPDLSVAENIALGFEGPRMMRRV